MTKTKLAKAISMAAAGVALSAAASSASAGVMYNTFTTAANTATDGWTRVNDIGSTVTTTDPVTGVVTVTPVAPDGVYTGPESKGNSGNLVPWLGTAGGALPFGYVGSSHLNWAAEINGAGSSLTVSSANALATYGVAAEIDTGGGAWNDNGLNAAGVATATGPTGWKHQTDIGLITSDVTQNVTLNLSTVNGLFSRFGVTVFEGMDTNTANYSHHGAWNNSTNPFTKENPFGTTGLINKGYSDNVTSTIGYTFLAEAGKTYSLYLGGVGFSRWNTGVDGYVLNMTTSAVPVPGAVWLFGSAMAGLIGFGRRKATVAA